MLLHLGGMRTQCADRARGTIDDAAAPVRHGAIRRPAADNVAFGEQYGHTGQRRMNSAPWAPATAVRRAGRCPRRPTARGHHEHAAERLGEVTDEQIAAASDEDRDASGVPARTWREVYPIARVAVPCWAVTMVDLMAT